MVAKKSERKVIEISAFIINRLNDDNKKLKVAVNFNTKNFQKGQ